MYSNEKLLEMLKSEKSSVRYEACIRLQTVKESSPEIIEALEKATHDEDSNVAERANLALQADVHHTMAIKMRMIESDNIEVQNTQQENKISTMKSTDRKRGGCLTVWLCLLLTTPILILYMNTSSTIRKSQVIMPGTDIPIIWILWFAYFVFAIGIWKWKKWGVYGFVMTYFVSFLINILSSGILSSLLGLIGPVIFFILIRPVWHQMD